MYNKEGHHMISSHAEGRMQQSMPEEQHREQLKSCFKVHTQFVLPTCITID